MATLDDLDAKAFEVLEAIYESGGEANTSEIKQYTGIEKNAIILYRYDRLEEAGLVTTRTGESDGSRVPPKVAELTEEGAERIAEGLFDSEDLTIVERMERLERQFRAVVDEYRDVEKEFREFRYDEETDEEVSAKDLMEGLERMDEMGEKIEEVYEEAGDIERLHERIRSLMESHASYRQAVDEMDAELHEVQEKVGDGFDQFDVEQLQSSVARAEAEAETAREEADDLRAEVQTLRSNQSEMQQRIEVLEEQTRNRQESQSGGLLSRLR